MRCEGVKLGVGGAAEDCDGTRSSITTKPIYGFHIIRNRLTEFILGIMLVHCGYNIILKPHQSKLTYSNIILETLSYTT